MGGVREYSLEQVIPELYFKIGVKVNQMKREWAKGGQPTQRNKPEYH